MTLLSSFQCISTPACVVRRRLADWDAAGRPGSSDQTGRCSKITLPSV